MPFLDSHQLTFHDCNEDSDIEGNLMVFKVTVGDDGPGDDDEEEEEKDVEI